MKYTAKYLIQKRKEKWNKHKNIEEDKRFREAVANELYDNKELLSEVKNNPEYLIELEFVVVDKNQKTMPFFLNEVQNSFIDTLNKAKEDFEKGIITDISLIVLKGRQQGFTTLITAYQLASSILSKNFQGFTLADKSDNSEAIFQNKAKFPHSQLPEKLKPTEKFNNRKQLLFEKINSSWAVDTATKDVGRSRTVNFFHGSECAFWKDGIAPIQSALGEAFTKNCIKIYESTANGYNDYRTMWKSGTHINCFYEWWRTKEYRTNFENEEIKQEFIKNIDISKEWIFERIKILINEKQLELEQVYWYYKKYQTYIDKELIKQEYPCSSEEAFLSSGNCYFNKDKIINRLTQIKEPLKRGSFIYDFDDRRNKISNIRFKEESDGFIDIFELPKVNYPYVLSGDTSGEGSDYFTGQVLENTSGKQVAKLRKQFDADEYTRQMYCLGMYYNKALIGIETNFDTFPIRKLLEFGYDKQFIREKEDTYTGKLNKAYGFKTDRITRPLILSLLQSIVNDHIELINDKDTLEEMLVFIRNEKGRPEAQAGCHDDLVMALAIAYYIRPQQDMKLKVNINVIQENIMRDFGFENDTKDDEIVVF